MSEADPKDHQVDRLRRSLLEGDLDGARRILGSTQRDPCFTSRPAHVTPTDGAMDPSPLGEAWGGREILVRTDAGEVACWQSEPDPASLDEAADEIASSFWSCMKGRGERFDELSASAGLCHLADASESDVVFLRSHTIGGSGGETLLIGRVTSRNGQMHLTQRFARRPAEEIAVLQLFADACDKAGVLVMYGGKGDAPQVLRKRMGAVGMSEPWGCPPAMLVRTDCRHLWAGELPGFGLRVLEQMGLGRSRTGGIAPSALKRAASAYRQRGEVRAMAKLLRRNALDLLVLMELCCFLLTGRGPVGTY